MESKANNQSKKKPVVRKKRTVFLSNKSLNNMTNISERNKVSLSETVNNILSKFSSDKQVFLFGVPNKYLENEELLRAHLEAQVDIAIKKFFFKDMENEEIEKNN